MRIMLDESHEAIAAALVEKIEELRRENEKIREDNYLLKSENLTLLAVLTCRHAVRKGVGVDSIFRRN